MQGAVAVGMLVLAYLLGGVPFGLLVARAYGAGDVRAHGSGNIGATNVWRVAGRQAALWVYLLDIGKGALAVVLAQLVHQAVLPRDTFLVLVAIVAVLGHVFSPYIGFKGGKGVNTGLGVMFILLPLETAISLVVFGIIVGISRYISLGSIVAAITLSIVVIMERVLFGKGVNDIYLYLSVVLALLVIFTHRKNIGRLIAGTENRFSLSSKKQAEVRSRG